VVAEGVRARRHQLVARSLLCKQVPPRWERKRLPAANWAASTEDLESIACYRPKIIQRKEGQRSVQEGVTPNLQAVKIVDRCEAELKRPAGPLVIVPADNDGQRIRP